MKKLAYGYNERKARTLALFAAHPEGLRPQDYAWQIKKFPARAAYSYLARLWRWGLLLRRDAPVTYRLSARGRDRLAWLQRRLHPMGAPARLKHEVYPQSGARAGAGFSLV